MDKIELIYILFPVWFSFFQSTERLLVQGACHFQLQLYQLSNLNVKGRVKWAVSLYIPHHVCSLCTGEFLLSLYET